MNRITLRWFVVSFCKFSEISVYICNFFYFSKIWNEEGQQAIDGDLPTFSLSPQSYITYVSIGVFVLVVLYTSVIMGGFVLCYTPL